MASTLPPVTMGRMMRFGNIEVSPEVIAEFCRRHHIIRLAFFGSVLREDFRPASDIDVLAEFEPGHTPGLAFFAIQDELCGLFGQRVDLNTPEDLSRHFREEVLRQAKVVYDAA